MIFAQGSSQCNEAADLVIQPWLGSNTRFTWTRTLEEISTQNGPSKMKSTNILNNAM